MAGKEVNTQGGSENVVNRTDIVLREVSQWKEPEKIKEKMRCKRPSSKI